MGNLRKDLIGGVNLILYYGVAGVAFGFGFTFGTAAAKKLQNKI